MALDERYIVASDLEQYFVDKDSGLPLAGGTLTFYRDVARTTPKTVYQLSGSPPNYTYTALPNPLTLSSVGTVQNSGGDNEVIYYFPYDDDGNLDLYYISVRDSNGVEQFSREAWPNVTAASDPTRDPFPVQNQISNPQFTKVLINDTETITYTVNAATDQEFEFAPNWDFVISGTGTVVVERVAISGNDNVVTSPPYVLDVTVSSNITACYLRQRFPYNSGLWASTDEQTMFISAFLIARNENNGTTGIQMFYQESTGGSAVTILDESFDNTGYAQLLGGAEIPVSTNTDEGEDGYIDIYISFLPSSHVRMSSVQVIPTQSDVSADLIKYDVNSSNREQALMGDYYIPRNNIKPIPSMLTGWDFTLNPAQFASASMVVTAGTAGYVWDQTIMNSTPSNVTVTADSVTQGLKVTFNGASTAFYVLQYLTGYEAKEILGTRLSVNITAWHNVNSSDVITTRAYLFRGSSSAVIPTLPNTIGSLAADGTFTKNNTAGQGQNWTEIARSGLDTATATVKEVNTSTSLQNINDGVDYGFSGWEVTNHSQINNTDKFCIVVTFAANNNNSFVVIPAISLVPGDIPTRPAPQTFSDVLAECMYYYETSFNYGITVPSANVTSQPVALMDYARTGGNDEVYPRTFGIQYKEPKVATPTNITLYSGSSTTASRVEAYVVRSGGAVAQGEVSTSNWSVVASGNKGIYYRANTAAAVLSVAQTGTLIDGFIAYHYVADARLGI